MRKYLLAIVGALALTLGVSAVEMSSLPNSIQSDNSALNTKFYAYQAATQAALNTILADLNTLTGKVTTLQAQVNSLQTQLTALTASVTKLTDTVNAILVCGAKGQTFSGSSCIATGGSDDGLAATINAIVACGAQGKVYDGSKCVSTGGGSTGLANESDPLFTAWKASYLSCAASGQLFNGSTCVVIGGATNSVSEPLFTDFYNKFFPGGWDSPTSFNWNTFFSRTSASTQPTGVHGWSIPYTEDYQWVRNWIYNIAGCAQSGQIYGNNGSGWTCIKASPAYSFGGNYQQLSAYSSIYCGTANPFTGGCSCPSGYNSSCDGSWAQGFGVSVRSCACYK